MSNSIPQKTCYKCGESKPATSEFFVTGKKSKNGLRNLCKVCKNQARRTTVPLPEGFRQCSRCKQVLPASHEFFYFHRRHGQERLDNYCIPCHREIGRSKPHEPPPSHLTCKDCGETKPATSE